MKLWILRPVKDLPKGDDPWAPWYDKAFGFVVRAETETEARTIADEGAGDENYKQTPWLEAKYSTCTELTADGDADVVMMDYHAA